MEKLLLLEEILKELEENRHEWLRIESEGEEDEMYCAGRIMSYTRMIRSIEERIKEL